jgi:hypothetical protein
MVESILMIIIGFSAIGVCAIPVHSSLDSRKIIFGILLIIIGIMTIVT